MENSKIRMSKREQELTQWTICGKESFKYYWAMPDFVLNDPGLKQAWENGYRIAKEEAIADHRVGYF